MKTYRVHLTRRDTPATVRELPPPKHRPWQVRKIVTPARVEFAGTLKESK